MVYWLQTLYAKQLIGLLTRGETPKRAIKSPYKPKKIKTLNYENSTVNKRNSKASLQR